MSKINKLSPEEKKQVDDFKKTAMIYVALAFVVLAGVAYLLINNKVDFSRYQKIKAQNLTEIGPKIQYVLQHSTPGVVWLVFCIFYVISKRANTPAVDPTSGYEHLTESAKSIFLNSLEQFVLIFCSQLILVTYLTPKQVLNIIPVINILFITGRITFWLGYPLRRSFGMLLNFGTLFPIIGYITYRYYSLFV